MKGPGSLGFRVLGFTVWVRDLGFRVLGFTVWFRDLGFRVLGFTVWFRDLGFRVSILTGVVPSNLAGTSPHCRVRFRTEGTTTAPGFRVGFGGLCTLTAQTGQARIHRFK